MSEDLKIKVSYEVDDSALKKSLATVQSNTTKALSGGSGGGGGGPQTAIDRSILQANKLQSHLSLLQDAHKSLASQPGMERNLAKVNQEMAGIYGQQKRIATSATDYLKNLDKEVVLRRQSAQLMIESNKQHAIYSAHSDRQFAMMQNMQRVTGSLPGGNIANQFMGGAGRAAAGAESGLGAVGMGALGGGLAAGAAAAAAGISALVSTMGELSSRSRELGQMGNSSPTGLGSLKNTLEQNSIRSDIAATSPASVGLAKTLSDWGAGMKDLVGHAFNNSQERNQALGERLGQGLGGVAGEQWLLLKQQRTDQEQDISITRQNLDEQTFRKNRDYAIQIKNFQVDTARQYQDLDKQKQRADWDHTLAVTKYQEDFAGKMAQAQYQVNKQFATESFQRSQGYAIADYSLNKTYKEQDFGINKSRSTADFARNKSYSQQDFSLNKSYALEDRRDQLFDMDMGGANGLQFLQASRDFRKSQRRAQQQFGIEQGRNQQTFDISQRYAGQDLAISESRDKTALGIGLSRNSEQFGQSQRQAAVGYQMDLASRQNDRMYEGIQLQEGWNRTVTDLNTSMQRLNQNVSRDALQISNAGRDLSVDTKMTYFQNDLATSRARRDQTNAMSMFAGSVRATDPLGAVGQGMKDSDFAQSLALNSSRTGQQDLFQQFNAANSKTSFGGQIGDVFNNGGAKNAAITAAGLGALIDTLSPFGSTNQALRHAQGGNKSGWTGVGDYAAGLGAGGINVNYQGSNHTFNVGPDKNQIISEIEKIASAGDQNTVNSIMEFLRREYGDKMTNSKELNDNFKILKAAIDGFKGTCRKAEDDYIALGKKTAGWLGEQAQTHLKSLFKAVEDDQERVLKNIAAAEERTLAAIEALHNQSLAQLTAKTDFELGNIHEAAAIAVAALEDDTPVTLAEDLKIK